MEADNAARFPAAPPMTEFLSLADDMARAHARMQELLTAVISLAEDLTLETVLQRVVQSACRLLGARYGALGVLGGDGTLSHFLTVGIDEADARRIGPLPTGHGVLGLLIRDPRPLRMHDLRRHPEAHGFPVHHPQMTSFLGVPISIRDEVFGNLYLTEKVGGGDFTAGDEELAVALAAAAAVAIDNARLFDDVRARERWLEAAMRVTSAVIGEVPPADAGQLILREAGQVSGAALAAVVTLVDDDGDARGYCEDAEGRGAADLVGRTVLLPAGVAADAASGQPVVLEARTGGLEFGSGFGSALVTALGPVGPGRCLLVLLRTPSDAPFAAAEARLAAAFASQVGVARELARTRRAREDLAVFADRDRIARDLHDLVIQRLFAAGLSIQSLRRSTTDEGALGRIGAVTAELDTTIRELRNTIYSLRDTRGDVERLSSRVLRIVLERSRTMPFSPRLRFFGAVDTEIVPAAQEQLLAVLSEAVSNAARHSGADAVDITLGVSDAGAELVVTDNGRGFEPDGVRQSGLANLEHRARLVDGSLELDTRPGSGTRLRFAVPPAAASDSSVTGARA